jgi:(p)ppGpp synthase/HD superfamily hydrolase
MSMDSARRIELQWAPEVDELYPVKIHVLCHDKMGLLASITGALSEAGANILDANVKTRADSRAECYFTVAVSGAQHLEKSMQSVNKIKYVIKVTRTAA